MSLKMRDFGVEPLMSVKPSETFAAAAGSPPGACTLE
jgi:hypothetical protein